MDKKLKNNFSKQKSFLLLFFLISVTAFRLNVVVAFSAFILILIYAIFSDLKIEITGILKWGIIFWGYYIFSILWSNNISDTLEYLPAIVYEIGILIFLPKLLKSKYDVSETIKILFYSLAFSAILTLVLTPISQFGTERMGTVLNLNANVFGFRMALGSLLSYYLLKSRSKTNSKKDIFNFIVLIIFFFLFSLLSLYSGSKKALLFFVGGIVIYEFLISKGFKKLLKILVLCICIMSIFYVIFHNDRLYNVIGFRIEKMLITITGNNTVQTTDKSYLERQFYKDTAIQLFKKKPIFGNGGNSFVTYIRSIGYSHVAYSHNNYTELLCTLGIIGLIIYYSYWIKVFISLFWIFKNSSEKFDKRLSLLFLVILFMLLVLDYGCVSYIVEFNIFLLCLFDVYVRAKKNENTNNV